MISIRDLTASPGQKISGNVHIGTSAGSSIDNSTSTVTEIPITIINGIEDGPTVLFLSGIHGSEYIPILASQRLAKDLDPSDLIQGSAILVHIANLPAYLGRTIYTSPADGKNLNRLFPGKPDGTVSERIAHFLVQEVYSLADYVLDMHSGDGNEQLGPSYTAYYGKAGSPEVIEASKAMAVAFGLNLTVEFQWELQGENTSGAIWGGSAAVVRGIPSIDAEIAPGMGTSHPYYVYQTYEGMLRVLNHLGMLSKKSKIKSIIDSEKDYPCINKERRDIEAPVEGSWVPLVDTGTYVAQGTSLGYVTDFYGRDQIFEALAPSDGLLLIRLDSPPVLEGDTLAVIAVLNESDEACELLKEEGILAANNLTASPSNTLIIWQWLAATGWLLALGTFVLTVIKGRRQKYRENSHVSTTDDREIEIL